MDPETLSYLLISQCVFELVVSLPNQGDLGAATFLLSSAVVVGIPPLDL